jgi:hypothetical protein
MQLLRISAAPSNAALDFVGRARQAKGVRYVVVSRQQVTQLCQRLRFFKDVVDDEIMIAMRHVPLDIVGDGLIQILNALRIV